MCGERINLCDTGHRCHKGRADGATRTHQISVLIRLPHKFLGYYVHYGKSVTDNRI